MKRNIITTIEFSKGQISINVIENLPTNRVEIFFDKSSMDKANAFFEASLKTIETKLGGKLKEVIVILEPSNKIGIETKLVKEEISISGDTVLKKDIDNLIEIISNKNKIENKEIFLIQPLKYEIKGIIKKRYLEAPLFKKGDYLQTTAVISFVNSAIVDFIKNIVHSHSLKITQVFNEIQTISQTKVSEGAIKNGVCLINVGHNQSFVSINKNNGTVDSLVLENSGFNSLKKGVSKTFGCTIKEADELLLIYGSMKSGLGKRVIYTRHDGIKEMSYSNIDLYKIIQMFNSRLLSVAKKYIEQKGVETMPLVISGRGSKFDGMLAFSKTIFDTNVSVYNPIDYLEINENNDNILGVMKINDRLNGVLGKKLQSIVETNPNTFTSLKKKETKNILHKIVNKLGGKYEWNK